ncbi:glycoside hydrolase family 19 protein [Rapidithrix thailandica]|uniref:Glycoside hydrolase family 19 protein n=1 Tax=Rapidithrix thailandica TaxID=413964 RepID=A0AAW9S0R6_9BACT
MKNSVWLIPETVCQIRCKALPILLFLLLIFGKASTHAQLLWSNDPASETHELKISGLHDIIPGTVSLINYSEREQGYRFYKPVAYYKYENQSVEINATAGCDSIPSYVEAGGYAAGSQVQNNGKVYQCKEWPYTGWCNGVASAYAPGAGTHWQDAWTFVSDCGNVGTNQPPQLTSLIPATIYLATLDTVTLKASASDPDGTISTVTFALNGQTYNGSLNGNQYQIPWVPPSFGTYNVEIIATDNEGASTTVSTSFTVQESTSGGNFLITEAQYNEIFRYRYGTDLATLELDPANDFFSYSAFVEAVHRMAKIEVLFERRSGTNLYRITRTDKTTNVSTVIRTDQDFNAEWNLNKPILTQTVDYGTFGNEGSQTTRLRELAAFMANIAQETTGGWDTAPGGRYSWGLYFREEQGYAGTNNIGYRDEGNVNYPPAPGKSYHGRGPIQLSWNYNYGQVSEFLYGDKNIMLNNPEMVIQDGALAFQTGIWFWMTPQYPKPSAHDVMVGNWTPSSYDLQRNRHPGLGMTVNIINGGIECGSGSENVKVTHRIGHYRRFAGILNVTTDLDNSDDCSYCGCAHMTPYRGLEPEPTARLTLDRETIEKEQVLSDENLKAYPNPSAGQFTLHYQLKEEGEVSLSIYDASGSQVVNLVNEYQEVGHHSVQWEASGMNSGLYIVRLLTGRQVKLIKLMVE